MENIYSKLESSRILHIIHRKQDFYQIEDGFRRNVVGEKEFIQLGAMQFDKGKTFSPHKHVWKAGEEKVIAQESWVVIKGRVKCSLYDTDGTLLVEPILSVGDCSITLEGGHTYTILEDDTLIYEYKTGPYKGQENDKVMLDEN